jgi:hypothetical protein
MKRKKYAFPPLFWELVILRTAAEGLAAQRPIREAVAAQVSEYSPLCHTEVESGHFFTFSTQFQK